ncbi:MAG TPA: YtxH domain-containing protein [Polyangiales bacterium]|jgi:uncharacterized membrane protein (DUF106 family)|nr:YtxH domain-containing protein [Polyangiales bacterium]
MQKLLKAAAFMAADDLLESLGLVRRQAVPTIMPALGFFVAGAVVGGCVALLMAPMTGDELLADLEERVRRTRERMRESSRSDDNNNGRAASRSRAHTPAGAGA